MIWSARVFSILVFFLIPLVFSVNSSFAEEEKKEEEKKGIMPLYEKLQKLEMTKG